MNKGLIKQRMALLELNQMQLAKIVGVTQGTMSRWMNDEAQPAANYLLTLADTLEVSIDRLMGRDSLANKDSVEHNLVKEDAFDQASDNMAEDSLASYGKKGLISIDVSHFEEQLKSMKSEMKMMQKEMSFLKELILQQKESYKDVKEELITG